MARKNLFQQKEPARYARIYQLQKDGTALPTDFLRDRVTSRVVTKKTTSRTAVPVRTVLRKGCECVKDISQITKTKSTDMIQTNVSRIPTELTNGSVGASLPQKAAAYGSTMGQWSIKLTNNSGSVQRTVIGDTAGLIGDFKNVGTLPATVLIDGTWGAATLGQIKSIVGDIPAFLVGIHLEADDEAFYGAGKVSNVVASLTNNSPDEGQIYFNKLAKGSTFNPRIREDEYYGFQMNAYAGVFVEIPNGRSITISWDVLAFGQSYLMNKADA